MDKSLINEKRYVLTELLPEKVDLEVCMNSKRYRQLNDAEYKDGTVVYWMNRDKRVNDNWALLFAQEFALKNSQKLIVVFNYENNYTRRRYDFLMKGLKEIEADLQKKNIPFYLSVDKSIVDTVNELKAGILITDFNPLKEVKNLVEGAAVNIAIPFYQVDAHNICPALEVSCKQEYAARTIRPKIKRILAEYLKEFSQLKKMPEVDFCENDWLKLESKMDIDESVPAIDWLKSGEVGAKEVLNDFISNKLSVYDEKRNDPTVDATSNLSPYLTYGYISAQRVALEVLKSKAKKQDKEAFLEELIIRKELSDNLCYYNDKYDTLEPCDRWAKETLLEHESDKREYLYSLEEFENAKTHDSLWNAAQMEMIKKGKMHSYMRMYWAKKILEWTPNAQEAIDIAIYLNNKYELDGCCPNGYVGVLWSIGGLHDRAWGQRLVYGKIRYMSYSGCKSKFDVDKYINSTLSSFFERKS